MAKSKGLSADFGFIRNAENAALLVGVYIIYPAQRHGSQATLGTTRRKVAKTKESHKILSGEGAGPAVLTLEIGLARDSL